MSKSDQHDPEGHEPTEEVGPAGCDVDPERGELKPGALEGKVQESQVTAQDELGEAFVAEPLTMIISPADGLPIPADETSVLSEAPAFSIDNVVCIEDERSFVELFNDEVVNLPGFQASPENFIILNRERYKLDGSARERMSFDPSRVVTKWGQRWVELGATEWQQAHDEMEAEMAPGRAFVGEDATPYVAVRPARERCKHYKRQVFSNDDQPDPTSIGHFIIFRNCTERRSVGGAFMSLRDEAVHACDYRDPPHMPSVEKHLDSKDRERLKRVVTRVPLFNMPVLDPTYVPPQGNPMAPQPKTNVMVPAVVAPSPFDEPRAERVAAPFAEPSGGAPLAPEGLVYIGSEPLSRAIQHLVEAWTDNDGPGLTAAATRTAAATEAVAAALGRDGDIGGEMAVRAVLRGAPISSISLQMLSSYTAVAVINLLQAKREGHGPAAVGALRAIAECCDRAGDNAAGGRVMQLVVGGNEARVMLAIRAPAEGSAPEGPVDALGTLDDAEAALAAAEAAAESDSAARAAFYLGATGKVLPPGSPPIPIPMPGSDDPPKTPRNT